MSGRIAGRYVLCVGDLTAGLSVITLIAGCEQNYQIGYAVSFWHAISAPVGVMIARNAGSLPDPIFAEKSGYHDLDPLIAEFGRRMAEAAGRMPFAEDHTRRNDERKKRLTVFLNAWVTV